MKYTLIVLLFAVIVCSPIGANFKESLKERRLKRREKIIECINKEGSEHLKQLLNENKDLKLGKILSQNKNTISVEDRKIFFSCRKKVISEFKMNRKHFNILTKKNKNH